MLELAQPQNRAMLVERFGQDKKLDEIGEIEEAELASVLIKL